MLQRGFLKRQETKENNQTVKRSRMFTFGGIFMILAGFLVLMLQMQQEQADNSFIGLILVIIGFLVISVSMWMSFFAQNKTRRR